MDDDITPDHEALIQFLYLAPIGLAQTRLDGEGAVHCIAAALLTPKKF